MSKPNYRPIIRSYLLSVLADEDHGITDPTEQQLFNHAKERFFSEYGWYMDRVGLQQAMREWLLGLALSVDYTYHDIEQRLLSWGIMKGNETEKQRDKALDQYWDRLAVRLISEFNKV